MSYYPQFPTFYAYPVPCPIQDFYTIYPLGLPTNPMMFDPFRPSQEPLVDLRKISLDSGIFSSPSSRKTSNTSTTSAMSNTNEEPVVEEELFDVPDNELSANIVQQVEFYFEDENLFKDKFLLKHVKRNKEGFVSIKLISSFKRVKHLTRDWRQVAFAIEVKSARLEVNDLKTKVRRIEPLPDLDELSTSKVLIALDLPSEKSSVESVAEIFSPYGEISLIRILRPGQYLPDEVKPFKSKHPEMADKICALVEFDESESALNAMKSLSNEDDGKLKVKKLISPTKKSPRKLSLPHYPPSFVERFHNQDPQLPNRVQGQQRKISVIHHHSKFVPIFEEKFRYSTNLGQKPGSLYTNYRPGRRSAGELSNPNHVSGNPINVIRQPRGPDSRGEFSTWCRYRMDRSTSDPDLGIQTTTEEEKNF